MMDSVAHPCSFLAICPRESVESVGALQDKYRKRKERRERGEIHYIVVGYRIRDSMV